MKGEGTWSEIDEGTANTPPETTAEPADRDIRWGSSQGVRLMFNDVHFSAADGDELTFTAEAQYPGILQPSIIGIKGERDNRAVSITALNPSAEETRVNFYAHDGYGGRAPNHARVTVNTNELRIIRENSLAGTAVGAPLVGQPYDLDGDESPDETIPTV